MNLFISENEGLFRLIVEYVAGFSAVCCPGAAGLIPCPVVHVTMIQTGITDSLWIDNFVYYITGTAHTYLNNTGELGRFCSPTMSICDR